MTNAARFIQMTSITATLLGLVSSSAFAASSNIHVSTEGDSSVSVHSSVKSSSTTTTTQTSNSSCHTTIVKDGQTIEKDCDENGNLDYESSDGKNKVHIGNNSVTVPPVPTTPQKPQTPIITHDVKISEDIPDVNIIKDEKEKDKEEAEKKIEEKKKEAKKRAEEKKSEIQKLFESIKKAFEALFSIGK